MKCIREDRDCYVCELSKDGKDCVGGELSLKAIAYFEILLDGEFAGTCAAPIIGEGDIVVCCKDEEELVKAKVALLDSTKRGLQSLRVSMTARPITREEFIELNKEVIDSPTLSIVEKFGDDEDEEEKCGGDDYYDETEEY